MSLKDTIQRIENQILPQSLGGVRGYVIDLRYINVSLTLTRLSRNQRGIRIIDKQLYYRPHPNPLPEGEGTVLVQRELEFQTR